MSKADNKQLEEAIKRLEHIDRYYDCNNYYSKHDLDCIETALKELKRLQEENKEIEELKFKKGTYAGEKINQMADKLNELIKDRNKQTKEREEK